MVIGAYEGNSRRVIPLDNCLLQNGESLKALKWFSENLNRLPGARHLKFLVTRVNRAGEMMVTLSGDAPILSEAEKIGKLLRQAVPSVQSLFFCHLNRRFAHALDGKCTRISGAPALSDTLLGLKFELAPQAFFQINPIQTEKLYTKALEAAGLTEGRKGRILDAYCGAGTITLAAARHADYAVGIEIVAPAIENARRNAKANGLAGNTRFICADAAKEIPRLISSGDRFDAAILDPPRKGADEALLTSLIKSNVPVISYVSCNPATLARDVKILAAGGYKLEWAQPVDMFPGTSHVETVVLLSKGEVDSKKIRVEFSLEDMDMSEFQDGATYTQIKDYVLEHSGLKVSNLYISQIKRKCGIEVGKNYNLPKSEDSRQPLCPPEKEKAIREAFKYFGMI